MSIYIIFFLLFIFFFVFFILKLKKYFRYKKIVKIGAVGENYVSKLLSDLNKKKYFVINNIILIHPNKKTSQIDHIIVSRKGIFVIETKNYSGCVFGHVKNKYWVHISSQNKHTIYNIIYQNQGHINAVKNLINKILLDNISFRKYIKFFVSILLFNNNCRVKIKKSFFFKTKFKICNFDNVIKNIKKIRRRNIISKKLYKKIISEIINNDMSSKKVLKSHIKQVRNQNKKV